MEESAPIRTVQIASLLVYEHLLPLIYAIMVNTAPTQAALALKVAEALAPHRDLELHAAAVHHTLKGEPDVGEIRRGLNEILESYDDDERRAAERIVFVLTNPRRPFARLND